MLSVAGFIKTEIPEQDNQHGMDMLAQYYFNEGRNIAGGINPGVNNAPIPPQLQRQADGKFALARQWFEKAAPKGDLYAMGNLAIMLDSGLGGRAIPIGPQNCASR